MLIYNRLTSSQIEAVDTEIARAKQDRPLKIHWVKTSDELEVALKNGLVELFCGIFGGWPFHEIFSKEEVCEIWRTLLNQEGFIFTACSDDDPQKPIALVASEPLLNRQSAIDLVTPVMGQLPNVDRMFYFAEHGVQENYRKQGIGRLMRDLLFSVNITCGFDQGAIMRTSESNYPQLSGTVYQRGGIILPVAEKVTWPRDWGFPDTDTRNYFWFNADAVQGLAKPYQSLQAIVLDGKGDDTVVILANTNLTDKDMAVLEVKINRSFPTTKDIRFAIPNPDNRKFNGKIVLRNSNRLFIEGECLFTGRMYLSRSFPATALVKTPRPSGAAARQLIM